MMEISENMNNKICLSFTQELWGLAGYNFAENIAKEQIRNKVDITKPFYIEFPDCVKSVTTSFIEGLLGGLLPDDDLKHIVFISVLKNINILSKSKKVSEAFNQSIKSYINEISEVDNGN